MKRLNKILNFVIEGFIATFIGYSLFESIGYYRHPEKYAMQSAPWYCGILMDGAITLVVVLIALVIKIAIKKHNKKDEKIQK